MRKSLIVLFGLFLSALMVIGSPFHPQANSKPIDQKPIKIVLSIWGGFAHAYIAQEKGFFKKNNVEVQLILKKEVRDVLELYKNKDVDGAFDVFTDVIIMQSQGYSSKVVYVTDYSQSSDSIIGKPQYNSLSDLKGKKISFVGFNTFSHVFVLKALQEAKVNEFEVSFDIVPEMDVLSALDEGRIDAGHTWEPMTSKALNKGYKILVKAGDIPGIITDVLFFHKDILESRPEEIKAVVRSLLEADEFVRTHPEEALDIMAKAEEMTAPEMQKSREGIHPLDIKENLISMHPSDEVISLYGSGKFIINFLINTGQLNQVPNLMDIIEARFIHELIHEGIK